MIEFHGWVNILESIDREYEQNKLSIIERLKQKLEDLNLENICFIKPIHGHFILSVNFLANHLSYELSATLDVFKYIAEIAEGSYGVLYIWNDEDIENENNFILYRIARGELDIFEEKLLSPCNPKIENG